MPHADDIAHVKLPSKNAQQVDDEKAEDVDEHVAEAEDVEVGFGKM